ncbi:hypothetical protein [Streptomyces sp. NPDC093598]|uniref:hypothetical protein n=1 Tax=Streptomyces sp. NPDC093598 TaxID=3366046 RepID=UPI0038122BFC
MSERLTPRAENETRTTKREADALRTRVAELEVERHTTNEALDDAVQALRGQRDRITELEAALAKYIGQEPTVVEEMAYLSRSVQAVADACDKAEQQALRWENPLPVPEWVGAIRQALELAPAPTEEAVS